MAANAFVRARIDEDLKNQAAEACWPDGADHL